MYEGKNLNILNVTLINNIKSMKIPITHYSGWGAAIPFPLGAVQWAPPQMRVWIYVVGGNNILKKICHIYSVVANIAY